MKMREEFEAWVSGRQVCKKYGATLKKDNVGSYLDYRINDRWLAWQASRAALGDSLPKRREPYYGKVGYGPYGEGWNECLDVVEEVLKNA